MRTSRRAAAVATTCGAVIGISGALAPAAQADSLSLSWKADATTTVKKLNQQVTFPASKFDATVTPNGDSGTITGTLALPDATTKVGLGKLKLVRITMAVTDASKVNGKARPSVKRASAVAFRVDARNGFAHPAIEAGFAKLVPAARTFGIAGMSVFNSYNAATLGFHTGTLARQGLLAFGSTDAESFTEDMGAELVAFLARVVERTAERWPIL